MRIYTANHSLPPNTDYLSQSFLANVTKLKPFKAQPPFPGRRSGHPPEREEVKAGVVRDSWSGMEPEGYLLAHQVACY